MLDTKKHWNLNKSWTEKPSSESKDRSNLEDLSLIFRADHRVPVSDALQWLRVKDIVLVQHWGRNLRSGKSNETQSCLSMVEQFCNIGEIAQLLILKLLSESFLKITTIWLLPVFLVRISVDCNPGNILYCSSSEFSGNQPLLSDCWFWQSCFWLNVYFYFPTNLEGAQSPLAMNLL